MEDEIFKEEFLEIDANTNPTTMHCLCCDERYPLVRARLTTVQYILQAFKQAHIDMGCSQEQYEKNMLLRKL